MDNYSEINYENNIKMLSLAYKYCQENFLHDEIIEVLSGDDDIKKQLCLISLKGVYSQSEADILVWNLTGKSGPVRETASYKILELISEPEFKGFFQTPQISNAFVKSVTDINPSVSRNAVEFIKYVDDCEYLYNEILKEIKITLADIDENSKNRSYVQNKKNFNLYWNLEALASIADRLSSADELLEILVRTAGSNDYTIRERTVRTASLYLSRNPEFARIIDLLKNDDNIYVKRYVNRA